MRITAVAFIIIWLALGCRQNDSRLRENSLLVFQESADSAFCAEDFKRVQECGNGEFFMTSQGKALYTAYCSHPDSIVYYRGQYAYTDTLITCTFDSKLVLGLEEKPGKKRFAETPRQTILLKPTGCEPDRFVLYTTGMSSRPGERSFTIFRSARPSRYAAFCKRTSAIPALIDFHCVYSADSVHSDREDQQMAAVNAIIDHYKYKYPRSRITRNETDSTFELSFTNLKAKKGDDGSPQLFLRIRKTPAGWLYGDLNLDSAEDLVALPVLSQGGTSYWNELAVFTSEKGRLRLRAVTSAMDLARCTAHSYNGSFVPLKISKGQIEGISYCYTDDDAECCPSVKLNMKVVLENDKLRVLK